MVRPLQLFINDYNPGNPEATQTFEARVVGALTLVGETSPITDVADNVYPDPVLTTTGSGQAIQDNSDKIYDSSVTADCKYRQNVQLRRCW